MPKDNDKVAKKASKRRRSDGSEAPEDEGTAPPKKSATGKERKRRRSGGSDAAEDERAPPTPKKVADGKASIEPSHSSDDVTTALASTSRGVQLEAVVEELGSDDAAEVPDAADELMMESADNLSGSGDEEEEDEDEEDSAEEEAEEGSIEDAEDADMLDDELVDAELEDDDDDESYDSQIEGDMQTNVDGAEEEPAADTAPLPALQGVKFLDDDEVKNVARSNMNRLLRSRRYHDDDVSEAIVKHPVGPRCFKCGFPGHVAASCPAPPQQPCNLCAAFGHHQAQCPKAMCYRCQGFGHSLRDCYNPEARSDVRSCVRCGQQSCKAGGQGDWYRFMEGCTRQYTKSDKKNVRCFVCGKTGHFCCKSTPEEAVTPTCCLCGKEGHTGQLNDCPDSLPKVLAGELAGESSRSRNRAQHASHTALDAGSGGHRGTSHDTYRDGVRSQFAGGGRMNGGNGGRPERAHDHHRPQHQGHHQQAQQYGERAPKLVSAAVRGYGPNSRHGYRDSGRSAGTAQPQSDWGSAQPSDWQRGNVAGRHAQQGRSHGDSYPRMGAQHAAMHPPPDQIQIHVPAQPRIQQPVMLQPGTVVLQAPLVHPAPQQVQQPQTMLAPLVHGGMNAPPPDVQPIVRYHEPTYDRPRMGSARHQDDLGWRSQHVGGGDAHRRGGGGRSEYRQPCDHRTEQASRSRSHRRY